MVRVVLAIVLAAGCGRIGFGDRTDGGRGTTDGSAVDGPAPPLVDLTAAAPLLTTENPLSESCGQYLIEIAGYDLSGQLWHPTVVAVGATAYFFIPCKYSDAGNWSMGLASYTPTTSGPQTASWFDGSAGTVGINELVKPTDLATSGQPIGSLENLAVAWDGHQLAGIAATQYAGGPSVMMPVTLGDPTQLAATDFEVGQLGALDIDANDGTWRGASTVERSVIVRDGAFDIFTMQNDAPTMTTPYIVVDQLSDATPPTITLAQAPLLTAASHPIVAADAASIYLISIDYASGFYQLRIAPSLDGLATATPVNLNLAQFQGAVGAWNHDLFAYTPRGEPRVIGAIPVDGALLIYYVAGDTDYAIDTAPYSSPRAIGVLRLTL